MNAIDRKFYNVPVPKKKNKTSWQETYGTYDGSRWEVGEDVNYMLIQNGFFFINAIIYFPVIGISKYKVRYPANFSFMLLPPWWFFLYCCCSNPLHDMPFEIKQCLYCIVITVCSLPYTGRANFAVIYIGETERECSHYHYSHSDSMASFALIGHRWLWHC